MKNEPNNPHIERASNALWNLFVNDILKRIEQDQPGGEAATKEAFMAGEVTVHVTADCHMSGMVVTVDMTVDGKRTFLYKCDSPNESLGDGGMLS